MKLWKETRESGTLGLGPTSGIVELGVLPCQGHVPSSVK